MIIHKETNGLFFCCEINPDLFTEEPAEKRWERILETLPCGIKEKTDAIDKINAELVHSLARVENQNTTKAREVGVKCIKEIATSTRQKARIQRTEDLISLVSMMTKEQLNKKFESIEAKERIKILKNFVLMAPWHKNEEQKNFIEELLKKEELKAIRTLYGKVQIAQKLNQTPPSPLPEKQISVVSYSTTKELKTLSRTVTQWEKDLKDTARLVYAISVGLSSEQKLKFEHSQIVIVNIAQALEKMKRKHDGASQILVALSDDKRIQGIATAKEQPVGMEVSWLATNPNNLNLVKQGVRGSGTALVKHIASITLAKGLPCVYLEPKPSSRSWYIDKLGFTEGCGCISLGKERMKALVSGA